MKKAEKSIQIVVNKVKGILNHCGIKARKAERERKKQVKMIEAEGRIVPAELLIAISDPESNPSAEDIESLKTPLDLLQALLLLEPVAAIASNVIDPQLLTHDSEAGDCEIYTTSQQVEEARIGNELSGNDSGSCAGDSDSDSCTSTDSITRNANFVALN